MWEWSVGQSHCRADPALLGGFVAGLLGISFGGWGGSLVVAVLGAIGLLFLLGLIKRG
ncbi:GlsB/YeaQ/YmgE family stress response membrane protein [Brevundimonas aveniformis]|uniref:GlsB/YeaQ/YmgE family stress response membrane protein n=1 Tax=Brevundimonas aveniformis TaxID=370977 RepID=UPI00316AECC7